ncbi:aromatic ring-hydroxylating dioxygenase subunit alpha [Aminobacter sp. NyZ550]|uniref:(2Fe-2S)-binding protein n=2 Tax=Aminobacter TaxID=31988 RepID=A0AAC8YMC7_AMIAI|nr:MULTISPECIES: aromatic ring-hydroxylating dioxygenase subunit alpha [Aminobacter]AMS40609.1 (2Fe-2S)-binding protein [Aminobacter aminovorans]MBA8905815.1 phenylpropionate dioxygenase-like ring-hydroxylating dioxygenase large terminal subunit [Aminobacter ciceronei]MBA9019594.1 phenylpropionate dioxygenase-like ring-hydroxylating dioxygenase large terminal subunit [Aminobacter ciceronei]MBB3706455.1 phenylpropionate dioxygenase-like ring-hydroxylating dioxygenase large terminal subunit [Amin
MTKTRCTDQVILDLWHPLAALSEVAAGVVVDTVLLEERLSFAIDGEGNAAVWRDRADLAEGSPVDIAVISGKLPLKLAYGYIWTSLGNPPADLFPIPEFDEVDRRKLNAATFGVNVSAPRAIENFLDMGHFPYVHTDILGAEPHTEVKEYDVEISVDRDEILATRCRFFQPMASTASDGGADVDYIYRVPHPYCSVLYKSSPLDESRLDVIAVFLQPIDQEHVRAHMLLCVLDEDNEDKVIKRFQQTIFGQDKPILENQFPKRLPLDPRAETPIRADKSAIAYRRWLSQKGVTYGVIPAAT